MSADGRSFGFDFHELVVDSFAGGGGASTGIRQAPVPLTGGKAVSV